MIKLLGIALVVVHLGVMLYFGTKVAPTAGEAAQLMPPGSAAAQDTPG